MTSNGNTAAGRMRRYRERKGSARIRSVKVPIYPLDAEALVKYGRLKPEDEDNRAAIVEAVEALVDDFTEGKLVPAGDA